MMVVPKVIMVPKVIVVVVTMLFAALQWVLGLNSEYQELIHTAEASVSSAATARVS
jgi:hypothetical protein